MGTRDTNPADAEKTLAVAWVSLAFGVTGFGFVVYAGWCEYRDKGNLDSDSVTGMSCVGLGALMFLAGGIFMLQKARQEGRQQRAIRAETTRDVEVVPEGDAAHWAPGTGVTGHGGRSLTLGGDYFVAPPLEIGTPISAYTSLVRGTRPSGPGAVLLAGLALGAAGALLGWLVMSVLEPKDPTAARCGAAVLGLLGAVFGWGWKRFKHACSYVGTAGVARFICMNERHDLRGSEVFLFQNATDLRTTQTRHYQNGVYQHTEFRFDWTDADEQIRFQITDTYRGSAKGRNPWVDMPYQWACAAEAAWTRYRLDNLADELARHGAVRFRLEGAGWLAVGPDGLDVHRGGETVRCSREDVWQFRLEKGTFTLRVHSGRAYTFDVDDMTNAQLFVQVMERVLGIELRM